MFQINYSPVDSLSRVFSNCPLPTLNTTSQKKKSSLNFGAETPRGPKNINSIFDRYLDQGPVTDTWLPFCMGVTNASLNNFPLNGCLAPG